MNGYLENKNYNFNLILYIWFIRFQNDVVIMVQKGKENFNLFGFRQDLIMFLFVIMWDIIVFLLFCKCSVYLSCKNLVNRYLVQCVLNIKILNKGNV